VTAAAKKSGDYAVLSQTDMMLLALTVSFHDEHESSKASTIVTAEDSTV
jgi:rRNA maturation endonuclease Nob1